MDSNVKFRLYKDNSEISQRYVTCERSQLFRVKHEIEPEYCTLKQITTDPESYEPITYQLELKDKFGLYGNK